MAQPLLVGRYQLLKELGRGGMGIVYEAAGPDAKRVALKLLLHAAPEVVDRFRREADALRFLCRHPGIVNLRDLGVHDGQPFLVMDLLDGGSLEYRVWRDLATQDSDQDPTDLPMRWDWVLRRPELSTGWLDLGRRVAAANPRRAVLLLRHAHGLERTAETAFWLARTARLAGLTDEARRVIDEGIGARGAHDWHLALHGELWLEAQARGGRGREVFERLAAGRAAADPLKSPRALLALSRALEAGGADADAERLARRALQRAFDRAR